MNEIRPHENIDKPTKKRFYRKTALIIALIIVTFLVAKVTLITKPQIKVNYVAEYNKITKPANYDPNLNAAPYYQKAFELCVEQPKQLSKSDVKAWPKDLPNEKHILLKEWVSTNSDALGQLKLGIQKSYYWLEHKGSSMWHVAMPSLAVARRLMYTICSHAKLNATNGNFKTAFSDLLICHRFGTHFTGPKTLVEQLVGISIGSNAVQAGFQILDKAKPDPDLLKSFQQKFQTLSSEQTFVDFTAERFNAYDTIQMMFTDDGKGGGHIKKSEFEGIVKMYKQQGQMSPQAIEEIRRSWNKLERRQTTELAEKVYEYFAGVVHKTPWQLHNEDKELKKVTEEMTKDNPLLYMIMPAVSRVMEISFRGKVETNALITTLAILSYKAQKGHLPENLDQLVTAGYLKEFPMDPFSDDPLVYKQIGNDFILYSFGADFDDDGGTPSKWGEGEQGGDQVFWPVSRKQK